LHDQRNRPRFGTREKVIGPRVGILTGAKVGPNPPASAAAAAWTVDATSSKAAPASSAEWTALMTSAGFGGAAPDYLWSFQQASGSIIDDIGAEDLTVAGGTYQQAVTGWTRKAWKTTDGAAESASGPTTQTGSVLVLAYIAIANTPAAERTVMYVNANKLNWDLTPNYQISAGSTVDGAAVHGTTVHPVVFRCDEGNSITAIYTDLEKIVPVHASIDTAIFFGGAIQAAATASYVYAAAWVGVPAQISATNIKTLLTTMGWSPAFTP
jgi:hypothetical protein